jgi:hypothetical protein
LRIIKSSYLNFAPACKIFYEIGPSGGVAAAIVMLFEQDGVEER